MLVPISWLRDFVDVNLPVDEVDTILTNAGLEVKYITTIGIPGADLVWDRDKIVLAQVLKSRTASQCGKTCSGDG